MPELQNMKCVACRRGAPTVTEEEIGILLPEIPDWNIVEIESIKRLENSYEFNNFVQALDFTKMIGGIAEQEGHHPAILTEWGRVKVSWWTHKIKGLHKNDFIMASKTDSLFSAVKM